MTIATPSDLAAYLKQDVDTSTATLALAIASTLFETEADTKFSPTTATYQVEGRGQPVISLPRAPVISIQAVRIAGVTLAASDYTVVMANLYRVIGWGRVWGATVATAPYLGFPPELVEVDYTYGYASAPDDVKGAVLETAGSAYSNPNLAVASVSIDDYAVKFARGAGGIQLGPAAQALAERYRTGGFA